jgi:tetratricopeptide (TPR) repeat protein
MISSIAMAASIGWSMRDRQSRRVAIERQLTETIEGIRTAYDNDEIETAISVTRSAENFSNMGDVDLELQNAVRQWQADLEAIHRLEEIHSNMTLLRRGKFDLTKAAPKFAEALTDYGLILDEAELDSNINRLRRSRIGLRLVLFVDTLSIVERSDLRPTFVRLANAVDGDRWRNSFRAAMLRNDTHTLEILAEAKDCLVQPSVSISNIIIQLYISGNKQAAIELLRRYQQSRPSDFWINHMLGTLLNDADASPADAVGYLRVAVSIRPNSSPARNNLGVALTRAGQTDEIEKQFLEAARLDPLDPTPCMNLAYMYQGTRPRERAEWGRKAHELDPTIPDAHYMIAEGYELDGNYQASI